MNKIRKITIVSEDFTEELIGLFVSETSEELDMRKLVNFKSSDFIEEATFIKNHEGVTVSVPSHYESSIYMDVISDVIRKDTQRIIN